jgi:hypothetical protein
MRWAKGNLIPGNKLEVRIQPTGTRGTTFRPTVVNVEPHRELRWIGRLWVGGLFDGEHVLRIEPIGDNKVRFEQSETFTGAFVRLLAKSLDRDTLRGFKEMNNALKLRAEGVSRYQRADSPAAKP